MHNQPQTPATIDFKEYALTCMKQEVDKFINDLGDIGTAMNDLGTLHDAFYGGITHKDYNPDELLWLNYSYRRVQMLLCNLQKWHYEYRLSE